MKKDILTGEHRFSIDKPKKSARLKERKKRKERMRTYNTYRSYRPYRRHANIFVGWDCSFKSDGKNWTWKLSPRVSTREDAEGMVFKRFPAATEIKIRKMISEE